MNRLDKEKADDLASGLAYGARLAVAAKMTRAEFIAKIAEMAEVAYEFAREASEIT